MKRIAACILFMAGLGTLMALGVWQHQRLQWKTGIIQTLNAQYATLPTRSATLSHARITHGAAYLVGKIAGPLLRDKAIMVGPKSRNRQIGYEVIVPLDMGDGIILVNLGWSAQKDISALDLPRHLVAGGLARRPDYSAFIADNSPANNLWFHIDVDQIAAAKNIDNVVPPVFYAQDTIIPGIIPHDAHWLPRNKHKQYMLFWFGMAGIWIAVFGLAYRRHQRI